MSDPISIILVTSLLLSLIALAFVVICWKVERNRRELNAKHFRATDRHTQDQLRKKSEGLLANCKPRPYVDHTRYPNQVRFGP